MFKKSGDMQKRRFAGAGRCDQRHGLTRPDSKLGAFEDIKRGIALAKPAADLMQQYDRTLFAADRWRRLDNRSVRCGVVHCPITRNATLRQDRAAPPARTDKASRAATGPAP